MKRNWKKQIALCLSFLLLNGMFAACDTESTLATEPAPTEPDGEAKVLKILTLGSSSSVDACHMLNLILATEGIGAYDEVIVGTLYYSGCKLHEHVRFLTQDADVYRLYLSSSKTPEKAPNTMDNVTMKTALTFDYWDIIFLQAGGVETDKDETFTNGNIQTIQNYVNQHKRNPLAIFGYHFTGIPATDPDLMYSYPYSPNGYEIAYAKYHNDRMAYYNARAAMIEKYIFTDETIDLKICSITAIMNAETSYLTEKDLYRDYTHSTDLGRVMTAYVWYCRLMGVEQLEEVKLDAIPRQFLKSTVDKTQDRPITDAEKVIILESVNNALKNPLQVTNSQHTEPPAQ